MGFIAIKFQLLCLDQTISAEILTYVTEEFVFYDYILSL